MHKEKFIYEVKEKVYRIKIIRERTKIRIDEYIYGNIQNAVYKCYYKTDKNVKVKS